jgi:hypothetical protein
MKLPTIFRGRCRNDTVGLEADFEIVFKTNTQGAVGGQINISEPLAGTAVFSGIIEGSKICVASGGPEDRIRIAWSGIFVDNKISGGYVAYDERLLLKLAGINNVHRGSWACEQLTEISRNQSNDIESGPMPPPLPRNDRVAALSKIIAVLGGFRCKEMFVAPTIPSTKLNNALKQYAGNISADDALLLYDNTVFGSAKEGFILAPTKIVWLNSGGVPQSCEYSRIGEIATIPSSSIFKLAHVTFDNNFIEVNGASVIERNQLAALMALVLKGLKDLQ